MADGRKTLADVRGDRKKAYKQCRTCFMTGKPCSYQRNISFRLQDSERKKAFMLMPFRSILDEVYRAQLEPCLRSVVQEVQRADDISRTGYVICEKICREIQESHLICAEISSDNPNVFYELGLAYAMERDIALFVQKSVKDSRGNIMGKLAIQDCCNEYTPFSMIRDTGVLLWNCGDETHDAANSDQVFILLSDTTAFNEEVNKQNFEYSIDGLCRGAIHRALDDLRKKNDSVWSLDKTLTVVEELDKYKAGDGNDWNFENVEQGIRESDCVIICTSKEKPTSFFWLGFAHGLEKNVVPITVLAPREQSTSVSFPTQTSETLARNNPNIDPLPFDMRALWHIYFYCDRPKELETQINSIIQIIVDKNKDVLQRSRFWMPLMQQGSASIFVGSVELTQHGRHVVGEWDYRTVSELSSFFSSIKETMEIQIQTPIFQASVKLLEDQKSMQLSKYNEELKGKLLSENSIIIASADVNDMTEVALASYAGLAPFGSTPEIEDNGQIQMDAGFNGLVAFKSSEYVAGPEKAQEFPCSYYFLVNKKAGNMRGFYDIKGGSAHPERTYQSPYISYDRKRSDGTIDSSADYSVYYAHIAKFMLPGPSHWTVVIQGITGPATLGAAQAVTGARYEQFTIFDESITEEKRQELLEAVAGEGDNQSKTLLSLLDENNGSIKRECLHEHSETIAEQLIEGFEGGRSVEALIKVYVMNGEDEYHDERKIIWWDIGEMEPRQMSLASSQK